MEVQKIPLKKESRKSRGSELFNERLNQCSSSILELYKELYADHPSCNEVFDSLVNIVINAYTDRPPTLKKRDVQKLEQHGWFLSNQLAGMSLYVDRFCGTLKNLSGQVDYFDALGVNVLHLMPLFESPPGESDGGYAVSDFKKVDPRFGNLQDLQQLAKKLHTNEKFLMTDMVLNHTSHRHIWAKKAKEGIIDYQEFYYMYDDHTIPAEFELSMPEIFPESAPGNFTYVEECKKWVMTVFHNYQWDLNYTNPAVLVAMIDTLFFYANLGVDILRIDAPAFIWKQAGTSSQNLPKAHTILQLIKQCVHVATPGMALLAEAIVAPNDIMQYFGKGNFAGKESDLAYNATQMAVQWDALATGDTRVMLSAQNILLQKPSGTTWITYTRCHDDIGLGYDDYMISQSGYDPWLHRQFIKSHYSGSADGSWSTGALFSINPATGDARISGTLASLCGLEKALDEKDEDMISQAIRKILLMQAQSFFIGGLPMLYYGDESGTTNDYSYLQDEGKSYDNRWMHRPIIKREKPPGIAGTAQQKIFAGTQQLLKIRKKCPAVADHNNISWFPATNIHIAAFVRTSIEQNLYCLFNYGSKPAGLTWYTFKEKGLKTELLFDHWSEQNFKAGSDDEFLVIPPHGFFLLEEKL
ncbi:MAG: amylosucrase [Ginsengibacter sp.]